MPITMQRKDRYGGSLSNRGSRRSNPEALSALAYEKDHVDIETYTRAQP